MPCRVAFPVRISLISAAIVAAGATHAAAPAQQLEHYGQLAFTPCTLAAPGHAGTVAARCASLAVPERPPDTGDQPREIRLAIAWVQAAAKRPQPDPVLMLAGGPGQSALESYPMAAGAFHDLLRQRDVLLIDQRGTGGSNPLRCTLDDPAEAGVFDRPTPDAAELARLTADCAAGLDADTRHYTTGDAVRDLEAVREALGIERWNLLGVSYGTRLGLEYLRRHPQRVRTLILDGVVPPQLALGQEHARNLEASLDAQFARCAEIAACRERFGVPRETLAALLERLSAEPPLVRYRDPFSHELREERLTRERVAMVARLYAYAPALAAMLPMTLHEALAGRPETLMAQSRMIESLVGEQIADGLQLSVLCAEDADLLRVDPRDAGTLLGTEFVEFLRTQCGVWPHGGRPADFHDPVHSAQPVLLLSGEFDPVTPPRYGETVAATLPNSRHLVVRGAGHGVGGVGCMPWLLERFVAGADHAQLAAGCLERQWRVPPFTGPQGWEP